MGFASIKEIVVDSEKRQKMMLFTAAVLSVGAGSYWFFGRDSDVGRPDALVEGDVVRKPRVTDVAPTPPRKPTQAGSAEEEATVPARKIREDPENTNPVRKPKPRPEKSGTKKPVILPAG